MKKWLAILAVTAFASMSQGQRLNDAWYYDGVLDGTALNGAGCGSVSNSALTFAHKAGYSSVSNEMQRFDSASNLTSENKGIFANRTPTAPAANAVGGEFEFSYDIVSADFSGTALSNATTSTGYYIRGVGLDTGIRMSYQGKLNVTNVVDFGSGPVTNIYPDADQIQLLVRSTDLGGWRVATNFFGPSVSNLKLITRVDIDALTTDMSFVSGGVTNLMHSGTLPSGFAISAIRQHIQFTNGGNNWEPGDVVLIDNLELVEFASAPPPPDTTVVDFWDYESNADGDALNLGVSSGYVGGVSFSAGDIAVITNNMLMFEHTSTNASQDSLFRTATPSTYSGWTTGKYELAWDFVAADFALTAASNQQANVGFAVRSKEGGNKDMGFRINFNGDQDKFNLQLHDGNGNNQTVATFAGNQLNDLRVRLFMDLDNAGVAGSASMFYSLGGGVDIPLTYDGVVHSGYQLDEYRMVVQTVNGGTGWQFGDTVFTDNLKFEKISAMPVPPVYSTVVDYQMNDTAGTLLEGLAQTGSDTGHVAGNDPFIATDGAGDLVYSVVTNNSYRNHNMATTFTEGQHRLEFTLSDWDLSSSSNQSAVKLGLYDDSSSLGINIGLQVNSTNGVRLRVAASGGDSGNVDIPSFTTGTGIVFRIDANLDAGSYVGSWKYTTDTDFSVIKSGSMGSVANIAVVKFITADTGWGASDFVNMDYATYSTTSTELPWNPETRWNEWLDLYPGLGASTNETDDLDEDGYNNVYEYGLGGDPTVPNSAHIPQFGDTTVDGGTNYILYVYAKLKDNESANRGLDYYLETTANLAFPSWTNDNYEVIGTGSLDAEFNAVTNRVSTDTLDAQFIQLKIDLNL